VRGGRSLNGAAAATLHLFWTRRPAYSAAGTRWTFPRPRPSARGEPVEGFHTASAQPPFIAKAP